MRKSDKKIDNQIRNVLSTVCERTLKEYHGFLWVTHLVDFYSFPESLRIVCVFETNQAKESFFEASYESDVTFAMQSAFDQIGIKLKNVKKHICYDTQEDCDRMHQGKWAVRLSVS